jgi:PAS domain S-box-containing protein
VRVAVERLELAVRGSDDGLWDWKIGDNEVWWSPRLREMLGYDQAEGGGLRGLEERLHPADRERVLSAIGDHLERRMPYDVEYRLRTGSGAYRWFWDRGQAIWDDESRPVRMSGSLRDITDSKEGGARGYPGSADLREPLEAIERFRQSLLDARANDQGADDAIIATRAAPAGRRVARLLDDLDTLSTAMDKELRREPVDLSAIARSEARKLRQSQPERKVALSVARDLAVDGDPDLLRLAIRHLLDNAWKFTSKRPEARIEVGATEEAAFYVRDDGAGFDPAQSDRLFGLFQRLHPATEFDGTGVGLATVRHIVRRHGGRVWAEGDVDAGATFYVSL